MPNRFFTLATCILVTGFLVNEAPAQQNAPNAGPAVGWQHFASQDNTQYLFTDSTPPLQVIQTQPIQPPLIQPPLNQPPLNQPPLNQPPLNKTPLNKTPANQTLLNETQANQTQLNHYVDSVYVPGQMQYQLDSEGESEFGNCCNPCNDARPGGLFFGAAAVFAKPHLKEAFQYSQTNLATGQQSLIPFEYGYQSTPRVWVGYQLTEGFGVRVTHWSYDDDGQPSSNVADGFNVYGAHAVSIIFPANIFASMPGETLTNTDSLKTQIQNYDITYDARVAGVEIVAALGLRYATLEQTLDSIALDPMGTPIGRLNWKRSYDGLGPSVSVEAKRRLGLSPLTVVAEGGGAFLFGTKTLNRTVLGDQSPQPAAPFLSLENADEVVGIGELGFGIEYCHWLVNGQRLLVRGQYEGSLWAEAGAPTLGFLGFEGFGVQVEFKR